MEEGMFSDYFWTYFIGLGSFFLLVLASWCVGEGGEILGQKYDASIIGGLVIAWLNTGFVFYFIFLLLKQIIDYFFIISFYSIIHHQHQKQYFLLLL